MKKSTRWLAFGLLAAALATTAAAQQTTFTAFVNGSPSASMPLGGTDYLAITQSSVTKKIAGNNFALLDSTQTLTNKSISGSANTLTNIPLTAFTGLGSATTVLHGGAGSPSFSAVSLTADITGTLAVGHGGTGLATGTSGGIPYFSSSSALASSGALAANQLVLGGGAGTTPASLGSLGTTTTLLHGNAAGAPTFGAVSLTADVSGILPGANGGTGNGFAALSGPASSLKTFTLPNASATILTSNAAVTPTQGGTGANLSATGGSNQVVQQSSTGANFTVGQLGCGALSNSVASCSTDATNAANISSGVLAAARGGAGTVNGILKANGSGTVSQATSGSDYAAPPTTGTGTPAMTIGGSSTGITFSQQVGRWTQQGDTVQQYVRIKLSSKGGLTGAVVITGLGVSGAAGLSQPCSVLSDGLAATAVTEIQPYVASGTSTVGFTKYSAGASTNLDGADLTDTTDLYLVCSYFH